MTHRIAIVGGGPGGMSAALSLHQAGFKVSLFERHSDSTSIGNGLTIPEPPVLVLRKLGVDLTDIAVPVRPVYARYDHHPRIAFPAMLSLDPPIRGEVYAMLRSQIYARMRDALPPGVLHARRRCVDFKDEPDGVYAIFDGHPRERFDLLVGADGVHSTVRRRLFHDFAINYNDVVCWQGYCFRDDLAQYEGQAIFMFDHDVQAAFTPLRLDGRLAWQWWVLEPGPPRRRFDGDGKAHVLRRLGSWFDPVPRLVEATPPERLLRRDLCDNNPMRVWSRGRVTLLGDAAHAVSPYLGYGAGMAIEDGYFLARALSGCDLSDRAALAAGLRAYEEERVMITAGLVRYGRLLSHVFHHASRGLQKARDFVLDHTKIPQRIMVRQYTKAISRVVAGISKAPSAPLAGPHVAGLRG